MTCPSHCDCVAPSGGTGWRGDRTVRRAWHHKAVRLFVERASAAVLVSIAGQYQKSIAHIVLRWLTHRDVVAVPKSVRKDRIVENVTVVDIDLSPDDMQTISTLDLKERGFVDHRDPVVVKRLGEAQRPT